MYWNNLHYNLPIRPVSNPHSTSKHANSSNNLTLSMSLIVGMQIPTCSVTSRVRSRKLAHSKRKRSISINIRGYEWLGRRAWEINGEIKRMLKGIRDCKRRRKREKGEAPAKKRGCILPKIIQKFNNKSLPCILKLHQIKAAPLSSKTLSSSLFPTKLLQSTTLTHFKFTTIP